MTLGVRHATVTDTLQGCIAISDRDGPCRLAEKYGVAETEYSRLIAPFEKG